MYNDNDPEILTFLPLITYTNSSFIICGNLPQVDIMPEKEISIRMTRKTYDLLMKRGEKSIKKAIDKAVDCSESHIVQSIIGRVTTGNAGLNRRQKEDGYVIMMCTMDSNERFVDIAMTREQMSDLIELLEFEIALLDK